MQKGSQNSLYQCFRHRIVHEWSLRVTYALVFALSPHPDWPILLLQVNVKNNERSCSLKLGTGLQYLR